MIIDGRQIAETIYTSLSERVKTLSASGILPKLAVLLVGDDPASLSFIKQKQKAAERIGATIEFTQYPATITTEDLRTTILELNRNPLIHGIIIQRPLPKDTTIDPFVLNNVNKRKDVDGFVTGSPFVVPVALATLLILQHVYTQSQNLPAQYDTLSNDFLNWLRPQSIVVIGRGETAGRPIAKLLTQKGCIPTVIHSHTEFPESMLKTADILISCVGKHMVRSEFIKEGSIQISVGISRGADGKMHGDYDDETIGLKAAFYTPTPGGVGPVNVACLMKNLVDATSQSSKQ